ncbi:MAG: LapA family protein [Anaerolineales bacterium]|nr:LapA family protein [Anaerolineales bacterium]
MQCGLPAPSSGGCDAGSTHFFTAVSDFAVQNADPTPVKFLFWKYESPLAVSLLISVLLGAIMSLLVSIPSLARLKLSLRNQRKRNTELEKNLNETNIKLAEVQIKAAELEKSLAAVNEQPPVEPPAATDKPA